MMRWLVIPALLLAACSSGGGSGGGGSSVTPAIVPMQSVDQPQPAAQEWHIGPWIGTLNYSLGLPLYMTQGAGGPYFDFGNGSSPHYVTRAITPSDIPLSRAKDIKIRFRLDGPAGTLIYGSGCPNTTHSTVSLYFSLPTEEEDGYPPKDQRVNWSQTSFRWWAEFARSAPLQVGQEYDLTAPLDASANWNTVFNPTDGSGRLSSEHPDWFARDKAGAGRVGFTFSNCGGAGHGAAASATVRFTLLEFAVE